MAKRKARVKRQNRKAPYTRKQGVRLQVFKAKLHRGTGYRWRTVSQRGNQRVIAVSGSAFKRQRTAALQGRRANPQLFGLKVEFV